MESIVNWIFGFTWVYVGLWIAIWGIVIHPVADLQRIQERTIYFLAGNYKAPVDVNTLIADLRQVSPVLLMPPDRSNTMFLASLVIFVILSFPAHYVQKLAEDNYLLQWAIGGGYIGSFLFSIYFLYIEARFFHNYNRLFKKYVEGNNIHPVMAEMHKTKN